MDSKDWNNMLAGRLYHAQDSELTARRLRARKLVFRYNQSAPEEEELRRELARELFGGMGENCYLNLRCGVTMERISGWGIAYMPTSTWWCWTVPPSRSAVMC